MDASDINAENATMLNDGEDAIAPLQQIPYYDEDLDEAFTGPPILEEWDETYDDSYEAESTRLIEGQESLALEPSRGDVSVHTQPLATGCILEAHRSWPRLLVPCFTSLSCCTYRWQPAALHVPTGSGPDHWFPA